METVTLTEGEKGIAVRKDQGGFWAVYECTVKTGYSGTRRYGSTMGTIKYKTERGAHKAMERWAGVFYYNKYKRLGTIDWTIYAGEEIK